MGVKRVDKSASRSISDDPEDGTWMAIDCETETGAFAIIADVPPPEAAPKPATKPATRGETSKRRTLDDMRRLSEEIKRKRQAGG
jgi:hypothetical protein